MRVLPSARRVEGRSRDLRLTKCGAHCRTFEPVAAGSRLVLSLVTPAGTKVDCEGTVVRSQGDSGAYLVATVFTAIGGPGSSELQQHLTRLSRLEPNGDGGASGR